jgi:hypothetical protein
VGRLAGTCALLATATLASAASAAAPPGTFSFKLPLPQANTGVIYELKASVKIPAGTTFSSTGSQFVFNVTNQPNLPGYIRAAAVVVPAGTGAWDIFIAINAPKNALKGRRLATAALDTTLDMTAQALPPLADFTPEIAQLHLINACRAFEARLRDKRRSAAFLVLMGANPDEAALIATYAEEADPHCK